MTRFRALMNKDWRLNRVAVVGLLLAGTLPYMFFIAYYFHEREFAATARSSERIAILQDEGVINLGPSIYKCMGDAASHASIFTIAIAVVFGGAAFAQERRERSAELLAMLPVRRWEILASKLMMAGGCLPAALVVHAGVKAVCGNYNSGLAVSEILLHRYQADKNLVGSGLAALALFGVAWMCSTFLTSPAIAASISIGVLCLVLGVEDLLGLPWYLGEARLIEIPAALGLCGLIDGSIYYMRRIAP